MRPKAAQSLLLAFIGRTSMRFLYSAAILKFVNQTIRNPTRFWPGRRMSDYRAFTVGQSGQFVELFDKWVIPHKSQPEKQFLTGVHPPVYRAAHCHRSQAHRSPQCPSGRQAKSFSSNRPCGVTTSKNLCGCFCVT